jgi:hypothetical protein
MLRRLLALAFVAVIAGLIAVTCLAALIGVRSDAEHGPVYAPSTVMAGLLRRPAAWLGRVVWVQGEAVPVDAASFATFCLRSRPCPSVATSTAALWNGGLGNGADGVPRDQVLPLVIAPEDRLLALLRRVPLVRGQLPAPQRLDILNLKTYRLRLQTAPCAWPARQTCYAALLLDGATRQPL